LYWLGIYSDSKRYLNHSAVCAYRYNSQDGKQIGWKFQHNMLECWTLVPTKIMKKDSAASDEKML
uniref:Uncharacterized protein n=1 Tax=Romanomermis culicivorax TaxID=13658 RepID=A0A915KZI7_ROMCU